MTFAKQARLCYVIATYSPFIVVGIAIDMLKLEVDIVLIGAKTLTILDHL